MGKYKYYVVWSGRKTGIYGSYDECEIQVKNFPGNGFKGTNSLDEAQMLLNRGSDLTEAPKDDPGEHSDELSLNDNDDDDCPF